MQEPGAWVLPLSDPEAADETIAGGKAAELCRLLQEGLPVPEAHLLPLSTFQAHFDQASPGILPDRPDLNPDLAEELTRLCNTLCITADDYVAVRSSALGEDGATTSFAGQHATYYYVTAQTIHKAVVDCWMSLWSDHAIAYRQNHHLDGNDFGMAVVIQKMIQSERSGVCFTQDPTDAMPDCALIESTWGLGAALVDGRVSPDRFWISEAGIEDRKISRKRLKVGEDLKDPDGQRLEPVPLNRQIQPTLTDVEVNQIADIARRIEATRGAPQDVEWAIDGDELFILQTRPLTHIERITPDAVEGRWILFKPTAENFSEPFTPMTVDLLRRVVAPFGLFIQGRFYINADMMAKLLPWDLDDESLADVLLMRGQPPDDLKFDWRRISRMAGLLSFGYLTMGITWHRTARLSLDHLEAFEHRCEETLLDDDLDPLATLITLILNEHPFRPINEFVIQANVSSIRYFLLIDLLRQLLRRMAPDFDQNKLAILCSGGDRMLSQQMVEGIRQLADIARADDELTNSLSNPELNLQTVTLRLDEQHPFNLALARFLSRFGHRGVRELDLAAPRWREDTTTVLSMVRNYVLRENDGVSESVVNPRIDSHGLRLAAEDELHQSIRRPWQRRLIDYLIRRIRFYVTLRENTRHYHTMGLATVREKLRALEQKLIHTGRLRCEDDIFFLEYAEAAALEVGALEWQDVEERIRTRRLHHQRISQQRPTESFNLHTRIPVLEPDDGVLKGDCACPGVASGVARVIRDPSVSADLLPGDILVAPYTDPAWTPLFPGAGAVIVEVGSYLSHAGTVAREYQIPCLVDVHDCTRKIRSGQRLRVNATEGWVEIVE